MGKVDAPLSLAERHETNGTSLRLNSRDEEDKHLIARSAET